MSARANAIRLEMATAVRLIGGADDKAEAAIHKASQATGLSVAVVGRLRWKKIKRVPADIADAVREALEAVNRKAEARAEHDRAIFIARIDALDAFARNSSDPEFVRARAAGIVEQARRSGLLDRPLAEADAATGPADVPLIPSASQSNSPR